MKKVLSVVLIVTMLLAIVACGAKGPDVTGRYVCVSYIDLFDQLQSGNGEYLQLNAGGKGFMCLSDDPDDEGEITWKLSGTSLKLTSLIFTFDGTLEDDVVEIEVLATVYTFAREGSDALRKLKKDLKATLAENEDEDEGNSGGDVTTEIPADILGMYVCTGWDIGGMEMDPAGEWLELESSTRGTVHISSIDFPFDWTIDGTTLTINQDVGVTYTATIENGVITLDTGMLYFFEKGEKPVETPEPTPEPTPTELPGFTTYTTEITIPSTWYGVLMADEIDYIGDIWGMFDYTSAGYPYFEIYETPELDYGEFDPILSMYIFEDPDFVLPDIGDGDAWFFDRWLTADDASEFTSLLYDGALYFVATYIDDTDGTTFDVWIMLREDGALWDEEYDILPPGYEEYKNNISSYG